MRVGQGVLFANLGGKRDCTGRYSGWLGVRPSSMAPQAKRRTLMPQVAHGSTAERLRAALARRKGITEKRMFGGICFLLKR